MSRVKSVVLGIILVVLVGSYNIFYSKSKVFKKKKKIMVRLN